MAAKKTKAATPAKKTTKPKAAAPKVEAPVVEPVAPEAEVAPDPAPDAPVDAPVEDQTPDADEPTVEATSDTHDAVEWYQGGLSAPDGGVYGDDLVRKPVAEPHEVNALRAGATLITREQLAEIKVRRAQSDISTLIAACEALLDEIEA